MPTIKEQLYQLCDTYISEREQAIKQAIADVQEAIANETKSSAGDKYETSREMMQQEMNKSQARLSELYKMKATLDHIVPTQRGSVVAPGSVVCTSKGNFYISISAGQLKVDGVTYYAISAASPMGSQLIGQPVGHVFVLNGKRFEIAAVF